jgi:predicted nucleotidyltransferase
MSPVDPNIEILELIARALGKITEHVVFVGGCATGLLITDAARPPVRATQDVDVIASVASISEYYEIGKELRMAGFSQTMSDEPICRWTLGNLKLDVMPTHEKVLGFSNRWYSDAVRTSNVVRLPRGQHIRLITAPYFIGTKIEAFHGRGRGDYRASHDIEDIITLVDGRQELKEEMLLSEQSLQDYIAEELETLLGIPAFFDALPGHLAPDAGNQARVTVIVERLRALARL